MYLCVFLSITHFKVIMSLASIYKETKCLLWQKKRCIMFLVLVYWCRWNQAQIYHQMSHLEDTLIGTANLSGQYKIHAVSQAWIHNRNCFHSRNWNLRVKPVLLENLNLFYCSQLSDLVHVKHCNFIDFTGAMQFILPKGLT